MMSKFFFSVLLIVLFSFTFVIAAGGGGGGGGSSGGSSSGGSSLGSGGGSGPFLYGLKCDDKGVLQFYEAPQIKPVQVKLWDGTLLEVAGEWQGSTFTSEEAMLVKSGSYEVVDGLNGNKKVDCPGLKFSCKLVNLNVESCVREGDRLEVHFTADNMDVNDLKFDFSRQGSGYAGKVLSYAKSGYSTELKSLKIRPLTLQGRYALEVEGATDISNIDLVQVSHPECVGKYYKYAKAKCVQEDVVVAEKEKKGEELKCGGYIDIKDRVQCRLGLREDQKDEYENFYPEECRVRSDVDDCLKTYKSVQPCWKMANGAERIACVRGALELGSFADEKKKCAKFMGENRDLCMDRWKQRGYALVKFRLYNLEENAEELMEKGYLSQEEVGDFVVKMEEKKQKFNLVGSTKGRKQILLDARQDWRELMSRVRE